ncbi:YeeE/YedE family protein [Apiospora arundinis]
MLDTIACGAAFGAALSAAAVHQPYVIVSQLKLTNFHMLESFLAAAASSALFTAVMQGTGYATLPPRSFSSLSLLGPLDGNLAGGLLQGAGMALSGACAGTVFAQNGAGVRSSFYALGGAMVGGIVWTGFLRPAIQRRQKQQEQQIPSPAPKKLTVDRQLGLSRGVTLVLLETMFVAVIGVAVSSTAARTRGPVHPVVGGVLIGLAQLFSILLRKSMLGTSTSFEEFGDYFWWLVGGAKRRSRPSSCKNIVFTASLALGSYLVSLRFPAMEIPGGGVDASSPARVALGGRHARHWVAHGRRLYLWPWH